MGGLDTRITERDLEDEVWNHQNARAGSEEVDAEMSLVIAFTRALFSKAFLPLFSLLWLAAPFVLYWLLV